VIAPLRKASLVLVIVVGVVGILPALLSERFTDASYRAAPADAITLAERAAFLNPFAAAPELARAAAAERANQPDTRVDALRSATEREPKNWATWALLGEAQAAAGDPAAGQRSCLEAQHIKPTVVCPGQSS
jgi:cytochrome c-type biogenesis protein CcmH/NrfG